MKLRKLFIGVLLITAVVCGGAEFSSFNHSFTSPVAAVSVSVSHQREIVSNGTSASLDMEVETELHYRFTDKISHRFNSSPPRASPLA